MRELMTSLCDDVDYQSRLRADFRQRRVHPTIESLVWAHTMGKPAERVQLSADLTMNQKLDQERELFSRLSVEQLQELRVESQALLDKALAMSRGQHVPQIEATCPGAHVDGDSTSAPADAPDGEVDNGGR